MIINKLKELVAENLESAIFELKQILKTNKILYNEIITISGRYNDAKNYFTLNIAQKTDIDTEYNKIRFALLNLIDKIKEKKGLKFDDIIKKDFYIEFAEVKLYNCNKNSKYPFLVREFFNTNLKQPEKLLLVELNYDKPEISQIPNYIQNEKNNSVTYVRSYFSSKRFIIHRKLIFLKEFGECSEAIFLKVDTQNTDILKNVPRLPKIDEIYNFTRQMNENEIKWNNFLFDKNT